MSTTCAPEATSVFDIRGLSAPIMTPVRVLTSQTVRKSTNQESVVELLDKKDIKPIIALKINKEKERKRENFVKIKEISTRDHSPKISRMKNAKKKAEFSGFFKIFWLLLVFTTIIEEIIPSRDGKPRRAIVKYQNPSEYDVSNNQVRITQRLTDRAIRSLVKIYDIHDYIIEEDLAQIADRLMRARNVPADGNLLHHPVCLSVNTEYQSNNLMCGLILMSSLLSGQSGGEQSLVSPQEIHQSAVRDHQQHRGYGEGDCRPSWPDDDADSHANNKTEDETPVEPFSAPPGTSMTVRSGPGLVEPHTQVTDQLELSPRSNTSPFHVSDHLNIVPDDELPGIYIWRFESKKKDLADIVKFVKTTNVVVNNTD